MHKALQLINILVPEHLKLRAIRLYRKLPFSIPHIIFHPTLKCNYACPYCLYHRYIEKGSSVNTSFIPYEQWIVLFEKFPRSTITFSGGEPLLYRDLDKLILGLGKRHIISQVISNISTNLDVLVRAKKANFRVMASFHKDMVPLKEFTKNLLYLRKNKFRIIVNYVGTNDNIKELNYYNEYFTKKIKVFFRTDAYEDLKRDIRDLTIKIHGINYIIDREKFNNYKTKQCLAGCKYFIVKPNAEVYRCHGGFLYSNSKDYSKISSAQDGDNFYLGNLKNSDFTLGDAKFICRSPCRGVCDIELGAVRLVDDSKAKHPAA